MCESLWDSKEVYFLSKYGFMGNLITSELARKTRYCARYAMSQILKAKLQIAAPNIFFKY